MTYDLKTTKNEGREKMNSKEISEAVLI